MKQIRVLQKQLLLGQTRKYNDTLTEQEWYSIGPHIRQSLISNGVIEVYDDGSGINETIQNLSARVDLLSDILQDQLGMKLGEYFSNKNAGVEAETSVEKASELIEDSVSETIEEDPVSEAVELVPPNKGDTIMFADEDEVKYTAIVKQVKVRTKVVMAKDTETGETWEVGFDDILT